MARAGWLDDVAARLCRVAGVVGVTLGGSRARDEHAADSDYDIGLYYRPPLDTAALGALARKLGGSGDEVTEPGQWGPWVDGGAWLAIEDMRVDWIYRDLDRVHHAWRLAQQGRFTFNAQTGHPLGVPDFAYAGELALGVVLADPSGELTALQEQTRRYPPQLADTLVERLWEADFLLGAVRKSMQRSDPAWVAGCLFRVVLLCTHALHGHAGRWLINEKGAVASAGRLDVSPSDFLARAQRILARVGATRLELSHTLDAADELVAATRAACRTTR